MGIMGRPGITAKLFETISKAGINVRLIATSEVKVSCVIESKLGSKALRCVSEAFEIDSKEIHINPINIGSGEPEVRGVALDTNQQQVSVINVPDVPGTAGTLCRALTEAGISLDTIVQSERKHVSGGRNISFTLNKEDRKKVDLAISSLLKSWPEAYIEDGEAIARISSVGAGMPSTIGTAARMFRAIANAEINIEMIATSEIRTTCIVAENNGVKALQAVHSFFNLNQQ